MTDERHLARRLWHVIEPLHAVTYFAPGAIEAAKATGLRGFWMCYFACRAAPMGRVGPGVVEATFANFATDMVQRAIPDAWAFADPATLVRVRAEAAAAELRGLVDGIDDLAGTVGPRLSAIVESADALGRPLFAANRDVAPLDDPVAGLWQLTTTLREHRGDGHVAILAAHDLDGCEVHHVMAAATGAPASVWQTNRGWTDDEWGAAADRLAGRGLVVDGELTAAGRELNDHVERSTDDLALAPVVAALGVDGAAALVEDLRPSVGAVMRSGVVPFPNPMGLPAAD